MTIVASTIAPNYALEPLLTAAPMCPTSYVRCGSSNLPSNFCCSYASTCISLDNSSSAICCPRGQTCAIIQPISCDVQLQNVASGPMNYIMTTRLDDSLPKCGDACCPFGYTCQDGSSCSMDTASAFIATSFSDSVASIPTASASFSTLTSTASTFTISTSTSLSSQASITTAPSSTTDTAALRTMGATPYPTVSSSANSLPGCNSTSADMIHKCESFPSKAVVAGFFPGAITGALATLLALFCLRRRPEHALLPTQKTSHCRQRPLDGAVINISGPIPSEEASYRTDFLRLKQNPDGARSKLSRTGSRVKSFFGSSPKSNGLATMDDAPPLPITPPPRVIPRREPSTESIMVYTPPNLFARDSTDFVKPERDPTARRDTTFTDMIQRVGFQNSVGEPCFRVTAIPTPGAGISRPPPV